MMYIDIVFFLFLVSEDFCASYEVIVFINGEILIIIYFIFYFLIFHEVVIFLVFSSMFQKFYIELQYTLKTP